MYHSLVINKYKETPEKDAVYIGRGSVWGNPYPITPEQDRLTVCYKYVDHLLQSLRDRKITFQMLRKLAKKQLVCFCMPQACHGIVINIAVGYAMAFKEDEEELFYSELLDNETFAKLSCKILEEVQQVYDSARQKKEAEKRVRKTSKKC